MSRFLWLLAAGVIAGLVVWYGFVGGVVQVYDATDGRDVAYGFLRILATVPGVSIALTILAMLADRRK